MHRDDLGAAEAPLHAPQGWAPSDTGRAMIATPARGRAIEAAVRSQALEQTAVHDMRGALQVVWALRGRRRR